MIVKEVILSEEEINYTQFCNYCVESYKAILSYVLLQKSEYGYKYSKETFEHFMSEYQQAEIKFFLNTQELLRKYAPEYLNSSEHQVVYNFELHLMTIYTGELNNDNE